MSIHQSDKYLNVFSCKGYEPLFLSSGGGKILKQYRIKYKTIIGGLCGDGVKKYDQETINEIKKVSHGQTVIYTLEEQKVLEENGFVKHDDFTFIVNIENIDTLWSNFDKKNRNDIRFAEKSDVVFSELNSYENMASLYKLFKDQAARWNFRIPRFDYFSNVWHLMVTKDMAKFFVVSKDTEIISIALIFIYGTEISMPIWGNNDKARTIRGANNFLIWKILEWGNKNGFKTFNFWGTDPDPSSPLSGIHKFKESFGGNLIKIYRYELDWWPYKLAKRIIKN